MVEINWTDSAIQDLNDIGDYIAQDSDKYAKITVNKLFDSADILEKFPKSGKTVPDFDDNTIRELIRGNYRIVYRIVNDNRIDIVTVHNCAKLLGDIFNLSDKK